MSLVVYQIHPYFDSLKTWVKLVDAVTPEKGNGFDIQGRFVPIMGTLEEGSLLCIGDSRRSEGSKFPFTVYNAAIVTEKKCNKWVHQDNVAYIRSSLTEFTFDEMEAAHRNYPVLGPILTKPIAPVLWTLLICLKAKGEAPESNRTRYINLEES